MIEVDVADYCQNCPRLVAETEKMTIHAQTGTYTETKIKCGRASRCAELVDYLKKNIENEGQKPELEKAQEKAPEKVPEKVPEAAKAQEKQESKWTKWWKRLRDRLCWIDVWDVLGTAWCIAGTAVAICVTIGVIAITIIAFGQA